MICAKNPYANVDALQLGVVKNHISIALTVSGMLLVDSWCQETYVSSISMHYFDIIRNYIIRTKHFDG